MAIQNDSMIQYTRDLDYLILESITKDLFKRYLGDQQS